MVHSVINLFFSNLFFCCWWLYQVHLFLFYAILLSCMWQDCVTGYTYKHASIFGGSSVNRSLYCIFKKLFTFEWHISISAFLVGVLTFFLALCMNNENTQHRYTSVPFVVFFPTTGTGKIEHDIKYLHVITLGYGHTGCKMMLPMVTQACSLSFLWPGCSQCMWLFQ